MKVAGAQQNPFKRSAMRALYQRSGGVPRLINIIADRALAGAYARELSSVNASMVHAAANEVQPSESRVHRNPWPGLIAATAALLLASVSIFMWGVPWMQLQNERSAALSSSSAMGQTTPAISSAMPDPPQQATVSGQLAPETSAALPLPQPAAPQEIVAAAADSMATAPADSPGQSAPGKEVGSLDSAWLDEQHGLAWQGLAELWQDGKNAHAIQAACDGQARTGYACLRDQGSWARVQSLGLPVILILHDQGDRQVLLRGLEGGRLLLGAGSEPMVFSREALESKWWGEYIVAWPQAPDWPAQIMRGESGAAVDIVMQLAAQANPAWTGGGVFDAGFESWLVDFQRRHALDADGIIGPRTLLYLMAPTITEPRLSMAGAERS
jgi:general secretion pathway protein A